MRSRPSSLPRRRSRKAASKLLFCRCASVSAPLATWTTSWPRASRVIAVVLRMCCSSSITRMRILIMALMGLGSGRRLDDHFHHGTGGRDGLGHLLGLLYGLDLDGG